MNHKMTARVTKIQIVAQITNQYRKFLPIPEDHNSLGFISSDYEDILFLALDEASKKANVKAIYENSAHCGRNNPWANQRGIVLGMLSGPKVEDVRNGMRYAKDFIENHSQYFCFNQDEHQYCYAHLIPKAGSYYQSKYNIPADSAVTHLTAPPVESTYALDKALKAGKTKIAHFYEIPTKTNQGGAILYGSESDCNASMKAFIEAVHYCYDHPMMMEQ